MRRILVALDESDAATKVAAFVNSFFGGLDVEVVAVNAGSVPVYWHPPGAMPGAVFAWPYPTPVEPIADSDDAREAAMRRGEDTIERSGLEFDEEVVELGDPADVIRNAAVEHEADLIVVGSHHRGFLERLFGGSVSRELVGDAPAPVLVVQV